jgi:tRNA threonylcarbamoyladenosine biosynthesis protein TsaE
MKSHSPEQTQLLGKRLGEIVLEGDVLLLEGELGTGKTCLIQGIANGLGIKQYAFSPSFVLIREYYGRLPLYHIDLYRLNNVEEINGLGLEEYLYGNGICVIEWAKKGLPVLPSDYLLIELNYVSTNETQRNISLCPRGKRYLDLIQQLTPIINGEQMWN